MISRGVVKDVRAANMTAYYVHAWMHGERFDLKKSQIKIHRARLRKIGIDIALEYDASKTPGVVIHNMREISMQETVMPDWYRQRVTPLHAVG